MLLNLILLKLIHFSSFEDSLVQYSDFYRVVIIKRKSPSNVVVSFIEAYSELKGVVQWMSQAVLLLGTRSQLHLFCILI